MHFDKFNPIQYRDLNIGAESGVNGRANLKAKMDTMDWVNSTVRKIDKNKGRISPSRNLIISQKDYLKDALNSIEGTIMSGTFSPILAENRGTASR
jgi:hypothetical protein